MNHEGFSKISSLKFSSKSLPFNSKVFKKTVPDFPGLQMLAVNIKSYLPSLIKADTTLRNIIFLSCYRLIVKVYKMLYNEKDCLKNLSWAMFVKDVCWTILVRFINGAFVHLRLGRSEGRKVWLEEICDVTELTNIPQPLLVDWTIFFHFIWKPKYL